MGVEYAFFLDHKDVDGEWKEIKAPKDSPLDISKSYFADLAEWFRDNADFVKSRTEHDNGMTFEYVSYSVSISKLENMVNKKKWDTVCWARPDDIQAYEIGYIYDLAEYVDGMYTKNDPLAREYYYLRNDSKEATGKEILQRAKILADWYDIFSMTNCSIRMETYY